MKMLYLNYDENAEINYIFIFCIFLIAEADTKERINNIITFNNQKELIQKIKDNCSYSFSKSSMSRILNDEKYLPYFSYDKENSKIILNNNFKKGKAQGNKFVILNSNEISFLIEQDNKLLNKYYLYLKYYCGYSKSKKIDTTQNQILSAIGYSCCSNNKNSLSNFNKLLQNKGYIKIDTCFDTLGHCRNTYSMRL